MSEVENNASEAIDKTTEMAETLKQTDETNDNGVTNDDSAKLDQIKDIYEFTVNDIDGNAVCLFSFKLLRIIVFCIICKLGIIVKVPW